MLSRDAKAHLISLTISLSLVGGLGFLSNIEKKPNTPAFKQTVVKIGKAAPASKDIPAQDLSKSIPIEAPQFVPDTKDTSRKNREDSVAKKEQDSPKKTVEEAPDVPIPEEATPSDEILSVAPLQIGEQTVQGPEVPGDEVIPIDIFDEPFKGVLVLGILVNEEGLPIDIRLLVPSGDPLIDATIPVSAWQAKYGPFDPPIEKGNPRWLPLRLDTRGGGLLP